MSNLTIESDEGMFRPKAINSAGKQCIKICVFIFAGKWKHFSGIHKDINSIDV